LAWAFWRRPAGFNGLFFAHAAAYLSGVAGYSPRQAVVVADDRVVVHALGILAVGASPNVWSRSCCCAPARSR